MILLGVSGGFNSKNAVVSKRTKFGARLPFYQCRRRSYSSELQLAKSAHDEPPDDLGIIMIPSSGISVTDELEEAQKDKFDSIVVPIHGLPGVAQIVTTASGGGIEPVRYLVSLSPPR